MIDLNHILLFIAVVSPLILLGRIRRLRDPRNRGWHMAAIIVLAGCAASWFLVPRIAGFVGSIFWCLLLLIPSLTERKIEELLLAHRWSQARQLSVIRTILHPWEDSPYRPKVLRALELAGAGRFDSALDQLAVQRNHLTPAGRFAAALTFTLTENWAGLLQWCRRDLSLTANPALRALFFRALGETGELDDLVLHLRAREEMREPRLTIDRPWISDLALTAAFAGEIDSFVRLTATDLLRLPSDQHHFWLATAELSAGKRDAGLARLQPLRASTHDALLRRSIDRRLDHPPVISPLSTMRRKFLTRLVSETIGSTREGASPFRGSGTPAVWALILLNAAMFGAEIMLGGATSPSILRNLGALEPSAVIVNHEYWRLLTALFLHYGILHLAINLIALYILGPALERTIGSVKFVVSYLLSGLGSSLGVVLLWSLRLTKSNLLVGASGSIMGVIGVSAGLLLLHRQKPLAGRQLQNIIAIVIIQTVFDLSNPQVSLAAHLSGFVSGVIIGLILALTSRQPERF